MPATNEIVPRLALVNPAGPPSSCVVILRNSTTPDREATIVAAGVHFFYTDEKGDSRGDYMAGPVRVELGSGVAAPFRSSDPRRTVTALVAAVRVRFGEKDSPKAKEHDFSVNVDAKVLTRNPPVRHFLAEVRVEFRVREEVRFTPASAEQWYELRVVP
jgi:hypothetical protein